MKTKFIYTVILTMVLFSVGFAANSIQIKSDSLKYLGAENKSVFKGNVVVERDNMTIHADNMTVFFSEEREVNRILADGNVKITDEDMYSMSDKAEMFMQENVIKLIRNVKIWQGENYLEGDEVIIYNNEDRMEVRKGEESRVKIIYYPDEKGNIGVNNGKESEKNLQKEGSGQ